MSQALNKLRIILSHPLARRAQAKTLFRIASWQLRSRLQREVIVPWIADQKLIAKRGMTGATGNTYVGLHEFTDMMFLLHFLRRGDVFLDIGANVGTITLGLWCLLRGAWNILANESLHASFVNRALSTAIC
jgi:hypothetical protein